jgi:hypothetical protein
VLIVTAQVEIIDLDDQGLADAHAGGVEQQKQQPVAVAGLGDHPQDGLDLLGGHRTRGRARQAGAVQPGHRIRSDHLGPVGPPQQGTQRGLAPGPSRGGLVGQSAQVGPQHAGGDPL